MNALEPTMHAPSAAVPMPTLFYSPGACSLASHIALEETGAAYEATEILLSEGRHNTPDYLAVNPRGRVPALRLGDRVITETPAILTYIGLAYPDARLFPMDGLDQIRCVSQMSWFASTVHIFQKAKFRPYHFADREEAFDDIRAKAAAGYWQCMEQIDAALAPERWMIGRDYTVVDPYALVFYNWGLGNNMPMSRLKAFTRHKERMVERPAVRAVLRKENNLRLFPETR